MNVYRDMQVTGISDFNLSLKEIDEITINEYLIMMEARDIRETHELFKLHMGAWLGQVVQAQTKNGKPKFKQFEDFFDYSSAIDNAKQRYRTNATSGSALVKQAKRERLAKIRQNLAEYERKRGEENGGKLLD